MGEHHPEIERRLEERRSRKEEEDIIHNQKKKILITGIAGSGASYLAEYLVFNKNDEYEVYGIKRWHSTTNTDNLFSIKKLIKLYDCDLNDLGSVIRVIRDIKPDIIVNMASLASVSDCFFNPIGVINNNVACTLNLFEAIRIVWGEAEQKPIVLHISSSEVYGNVPEEDCPIKETHLPDPVNPYSVSKLTQEKLAVCYLKSFNIPVKITRSFTYICPRRSDVFTSSFAKQVVEIEKGKREVLSHGNLKSVRCLIDVRDLSQAYEMAIKYCDIGTPYNIGGKNIISVGDFLERLKSKAKVKIETKENKDLLRPSDVSYQIPNTFKFHKKVGFEPKYSLDESIEWLLEYYRERV